MSSYVTRLVGLRRSLVRYIGGEPHGGEPQPDVRLIEQVLQDVQRRGTAMFDPLIQFGVTPTGRVLPPGQ